MKGRRGFVVVRFLLRTGGLRRAPRVRRRPSHRAGLCRLPPQACSHRDRSSLPGTCPKVQSRGSKSSQRGSWRKRAHRRRPRPSRRRAPDPARPTRRQQLRRTRRMRHPPPSWQVEPRDVERFLSLQRASSTAACQPIDSARRLMHIRDSNSSASVERTLRTFALLIGALQTLEPSGAARHLLAPTGGRKRLKRARKRSTRTGGRGDGAAAHLLGRTTVRSAKTRREAHDGDEGLAGRWLRTTGGQ